MSEELTMNRISKRGVYQAGMLSLGVSAVMSGLLPGATFAATKPAEASGSAFCTNLSSTSTNISSKITDLTTKLSAAQTSRTNQLAANRTKWDQALTTDRQKWDAQRQAEYTKLRGMAKTDTEKTAVETYVTTLQTAIQTRRTANDTARATFRTGEDQLIAQHQQTVNGQVATFSSSVKAAESAAQTSCAGDASSSASIHTTFVAALKAARSTYQSDRKDDSGVDAQIKQLAATRDASIKANDATFQTAADQARATLKTAFGSDASKI